jgi:predicted RNA-binding protein with PIN domain/phage shock protein A
VSTPVPDSPPDPLAASSSDALPGPLPEPVRARVVGLAAEALGRMDVEQLPPSLKKVATFAPVRRARLAGPQIAGAVAQDDGFRERLARQVRAELPELAAALDAGTAVPAADPVEVAAVAYLLRPDDWTERVLAAVEVMDAERVVAGHRQTADRVERLGVQLEQATEQLKEVRRRHREQVAELKEENADLRRKLGDARARARSAETAAEAAEARAQDVETASAARSTDQEAELRRLRGRVEQLDRDLAASRRAERTDRGSETLRARLLLDTMLETAQGLRRELALPAVEGAPADAVEAHVAEQGSRTSSGQGSLPVDDPALLDQLLALPRAHLVVDGYNVTKSAWPELSLERQRDRLLAGLAPLAARSRAEVTVVFDAGGTTDRPLVNRPRGVRVLYSPPGVIADDVIRELVAAEPQGRPVVVVSSDAEVVRDVRRAGARTVAATALSRLLARA